jgi:hypothetical protein
MAGKKVAKKRSTKPSTPEPAAKKKTAKHADVVLLAGGNPQIAKGDGDLPVQAYIAAMPEWKRDIGRRIDTLITGTLPEIRKAVKWNSPFYGTDRAWVLSFHCFNEYVKVAFLNGAKLKPLPPGESKDKNTRYLDIREEDAIDETRFADWLRQAAALPEWNP